ncbi:class I SAM-dependent methyltransferase [Roseivirga sp.]|uniref:O-methyltransferase n=1 Tax=Roseivirga sp. TaxID=1964215 RepID=UPI002B269FFA|nr:class I SAM-dependent methyltransferase [Roseivirga sp.]
MYQILAYIKYWLLAMNEHSLHSPFLYPFYTEVVKKDSKIGFEEIEALRKSLLQNEETILIEDLGAGSRVNNSNTRKVSQIAKHASTPARFSRLLNRIITHFDYKTIVELGTSLGLNSAYMASAKEGAQLFTFEGSTSIANLAKQNLGELNCTNYQLIEGNIDNTLPQWIENAPQIDLAYIDANHRYDPTLRYFELLLPKMTTSGMIILDDIHWSKEMNDAWEVLKKHPKVSLSIDLFEAGILFLQPDLMHENYVLEF